MAVLRADGGFVKQIAVAASNPDVVYAVVDDNAGNAGISKSTDGGLTWSDASSGIAIPFNLVGLTVDPTDPDRAWVGATNAVERTTNGGTLWTSPNTDLDGQFVEDVAGDPSDPDTLYAATQNNGIYRNTNGGDTWKHKSSGIPSVDRDIRALLIDPDHTSKVYAGALAGGLF
ncbi:MAG TPA: hypothetical protein VNN79_22340, partial [Actinomycetota bacterium]|nr:hypothetical protein [Actinomycetota bacterium]